MTNEYIPKDNIQSAHLLFIHGAGSSADFWHLQRAAFPNMHYVNLPGHGRGVYRETALHSGPPEKIVPQYADWVASYVASEKLERVVLNGHSMGGAVALELALRKPEWLQGVVLTCTGPRFLISPRSIEMLRENYKKGVDYITAESFGWRDVPLTYAQKVRRDGTRKQMLRTPQAVTLADYEGCLNFDARDRLGEITIPTLIITGSQDRITPPMLSRELHSGIAGSKLEVYEGAGHMVPMERALEYNELLGRFMSEMG